METLQLLDIPRDCHYVIAGMLDSASLVSFSLTCKPFYCPMAPITDSQKDKLIMEETSKPRKKGAAARKGKGKGVEEEMPAIVNSPPTTFTDYPLRTIPRTAFGVWICVRCVKYNYPSLFDYWSEKVKVRRHPGNLLPSMLKFAGAIVPKEQGAVMVGKIYSFMYTRGYSDVFGDSLAEGVMRANNIQHFESSIFTEGPHELYEYLCGSVRYGSIELAEHIATKFTTTFEVSDQYTEEDVVLDANNILYSYSVVCACANKIKTFNWLMRNISELDEGKRTRVFFTITEDIRDPNIMEAALKHPLFSHIIDDMFVWNHKEGHTIDPKLYYVLSHTVQSFCID